MRSWTRILLGAAVGLSAAACTSNGADNTTKPHPSTSAPATLTPPPKFSGVQHMLPTGKELRNDPNLYKSVALDGCTKIKGGWQAQGTATNDTDHALNYAVLVFFTDPQARAIDFARAEVEVGARSSTRWKATKTFKAPSNVNCVVRAVKSAS